MQEPFQKAMNMPVCNDKTEINGNFNVALYGARSIIKP